MIVTIARKHGSGGHNVAKALADKLNVACFSKQIVDKAAEGTNFSADVLRTFDEKRVSTFIIPESHYYGMHDGFRLNMQAATAQFEAIRKIAAQGDCVFVGRCADYVLREREDLFRVFLFADKESCINTLMKRYDLNYDQAKKLRKEVNKDRASFYRYYTDQIWGESENYDLCINTANLTYDDAADIIIAALKARGLVK